MFFRPFLNNTGGFDWKMAFQNATGFDGDKCLVPLVLGMKVRRRVIGMLHADIDAKKIGYDGHFFRFFFSLLGVTMLNPDDNTKASQPPKLLEQVRSRLRVKHYSIRTERTCVDRIKRFIWFHGKRHPKDMGAVEMEAFLSYLAVERNVSASTQNQAKSALLFCIRRCWVLNCLGWKTWFRPRRPSACRWMPESPPRL